MRLRILVVDDDHDFAASLSELLESYGHEVAIAHSGAEAVEIFRQCYFDFTLLDVKMEGMDGAESCAAFRRLRPHAKIMLMTGYNVRALVRQAMEHGALGVLHKPIDLELLLEALESAIPKRTILVGVDDPDLIATAGELFRSNGYVLQVVSPDPQAVTTALAGGVDLLVLDLRLAVGSGLDLLRLLKEHGGLLPAIVVTGCPVEEVDRIAPLKSMTATRVLSKPFDPNELLRTAEAITQ
jgi:two-component system response regulator HydG